MIGNDIFDLSWVATTVSMYKHLPPASLRISLFTYPCPDQPAHSRKRSFKISVSLFWGMCGETIYAVYLLRFICCSSGLMLIFLDAFLLYAFRSYVSSCLECCPLFSFFSPDGVPISESILFKGEWLLVNFEHFWPFGAQYRLFPSVSFLFWRVRAFSKRFCVWLRSWVAARSSFLTTRAPC